MIYRIWWCWKFQIWVHLVFISRFGSYKKEKEKMGQPVKSHEAQIAWTTLEAADRSSCDQSCLRLPRPQLTTPSPLPQLLVHAAAGG
jgi:hypothetical protein